MTRIGGLGSVVVGLAAALVGVVACGSDNGGSSASTTTTTTVAGLDLAAARGYCTSKGGTVQTREATWGTNNPQAQWQPLGHSAEMCRFQTLGDNDDSRIYVDLGSLYSELPTLASVAYLSKVPPKSTTVGNPATVNCAALAGSSQFGTGAAGGGWVNKEDAVDAVVGLCVFPDQSFIDEWGITYYAGGVVRGIDLAKVFRYQPTQVPPFFGR
jgi:putative hemolysin